jgi:hypothetical protein
MNDTKRNAGKLMMTYLIEIGRAKKKAGTATTAELAEAAGIPVEQAYSRLYWLEAREGKLESVGKGANRVWRLARKR